MPILDGQSLATIIRDTEPNLTNIPIIATSSSITNLEHVIEVSVGLTTYIAKPLTEEELIMVINDYLVL